MLESAAITTSDNDFVTYTRKSRKSLKPISHLDILFGYKQVTGLWLMISIFIFCINHGTLDHRDHLFNLNINLRE